LAFFQLVFATCAIEHDGVASSGFEATNESSFPDTNADGGVSVLDSIAAYREPWWRQLRPPRSARGALIRTPSNVALA
jgi:hypothetical protein